MDGNVEALLAGLGLGLGLVKAEVAELPGGLVSQVWSVRARDGRDLVLRTTSRGTASYEAEHHLLARLRSVGAPVPAPVVGSWEVGGWSGPSASVTTRVPGKPLSPADYQGAALSLAQMILLLQAVPVAGLRDRAARFGPGAWPWGPPPADLPVPEALAVEARILLAGEPVVVHGDLHDGNLLWDGTRLHVIDFGDAFAGVPAWELGSLAYFLGDGLAQQVARHQGTTVEPLATLAFALHRLVVSDDDTQETAHAHSVIAGVLAQPTGQRRRR